MKLHSFIGILISNHLKQFSRPVINIVIIYRPGCKFRFWSVNLSMIVVKTQQFGIV